MKPRHTDEELQSAVAEHGSIRRAAKALGMAHSSVSERLLKLEPAEISTHPARLQAEVEDGVVLVGSDAHIWPGEPTTALRALMAFSEELNPDLLVLNGDVFDGAKASRYPSIGWETKPTVSEEITTCQAALRGLKAKRRVWTLGNHDLRFETLIANKVPDLAGVYGVHLKDHFPDWECAWSLWVNSGPGRSPLVIKHRFKGGLHAPHNNTLHAGMSIATGHLHSLRVSPFSDYWGTRYGVDTGTLSRPYSEPFVHYTEDNPVNWRSGFVVFTFKGGRLLWPEVVAVVDEAKGVVQFRGELINV